MLGRRQRKYKDLDEELYAMLEQLGVESTASGMDYQEFIERVGQVVSDTVDQHAPEVARVLERRTSRMLRQHGRITRSFERRLKRRWGKALGLYYAVLVCAREWGEEFSRKNHEQAREEGDLVYEVLSGLHAQACRVAGEVYVLLKSGFSHGALARCRTLHELAVISMVISDHGRSADNGDLAEKFFEHDAVMQYKEAKEYQKHCEHLGTEPFSDEDMGEMRAGYDRLSQKYGDRFKIFRKEYGWAVGLVADPNFLELEKLVNMSHLRSYYKWSSKEIHVGARGWAHNLLEFRGEVSHLAGPTNNFLADPGQMSVISLYQVTTALLVSGSAEGSTPMDLLALKTIGELVDKCCEALAGAQRQLDEDEERILSMMKPGE